MMRKVGIGVGRWVEVMMVVVSTVVEVMVVVSTVALTVAATKNIPPRTPPMSSLTMLEGLPAAPTPDLAPRTPHEVPAPHEVLVLEAGKLWKAAMPPRNNRACGMAVGVRGPFVPQLGLDLGDPVDADVSTKPR